MEVTFITPTYNRAHTLSKTSESILGQTNGNWKWIIVDDGSNDNTESLVESFHDSRIKYIYQENAGPSAARNKGLEFVGTEWVAYIDSDNEVLPNFVETVLKYISDNPKGLYFLPMAKRTKEYFEDGKLVKIIDESSNYPETVSVVDVVHRNIKFDGNGFVHSKRIIEAGLKWDEGLRMIEDFDFFLTIANYFPDNFVYIPETILNYHMRFGVDALISNAKMMDHANAYEYVFQKHKNDKLMDGQSWYPSQVEKYRIKAQEASETVIK